MRNRLERAYDELSIVTKDFANMPNRFYQLDTSVVNFLEDLVDLLDNRDQSDNIEECRHLRSCLTKLDNHCKAF